MRQFTKMSNNKAINKWLKIIKLSTYNRDILTKSIITDNILSKGTKDNLIRILKGKKLREYKVRDYLIDRVYITSLIESYKSREELGVMKILFEIIGVKLFRTDKRMYQSLNGEYESCQKVFDLINNRFKEKGESKEFERLTLLKMKKESKVTNLTEEYLYIINNDLDSLYQDLENTKLIMKEVFSEYVIEDNIVGKIFFSKNKLRIKNIDFFNRFSINPIETKIGFMDRDIILKEIVLDGRLHLITAKCGKECLFVSTDSVGNILVKDPIFIGTVLEYYKLKEVGIDYKLSSIDEKSRVIDNKKVIRVNKESSRESIELSNKWNFRLDKNETLFRQNYLR